MNKYAQFVLTKRRIYSTDCEYLDFVFSVLSMIIFNLVICMICVYTNGMTINDFIPR